tara:strand:+ start:4482 stop:4796 length:315 start_codon:yes stop_codon:yes gene_type:complete
MTTEVEVEVKIKTSEEVEVKEPSLWKVILLNDETTTMEFVIMILTTYFAMSEEQATDMMVKIHEDGSAVVAVYPYELAEQKGVEVTLAARRDGYPLEVRIEEDV